MSKRKRPSNPSTSDNRPRRVSVPVTDEEYDELRKLATMTKVSLAEAARKAVRQALSEIHTLGA